MTLTDRDIESCIGSGGLIVNGDKRRIGPASYELRMGQVYYDLTEADTRIEVNPSESILIKPGHRVVLVSLEELKIPSNIIARIVSKGSLFSVGLSPVCTYADPGFQGNIGIVTQNISDKYIELPIGEPIAKVDFSQLTGDAAEPYRGQHGFQTSIWPIKHHLQKTYTQVSSDSRVESEKEEAYKLLPPATAHMLKEMERHQRSVDTAIVLAVIVNAVLLVMTTTEYIDATKGIIGNLIAAAIVAVFTFFTKWKN